MMTRAAAISPLRPISQGEPHSCHRSRVGNQPSSTNICIRTRSRNSVLKAMATMSLGMFYFGSI